MTDPPGSLLLADMTDQEEAKTWGLLTRLGHSRTRGELADKPGLPAACLRPDQHQLRPSADRDSESGFQRSGLGLTADEHWTDSSGGHPKRMPADACDVRCRLVSWGLQGPVSSRDGC